MRVLVVVDMQKDFIDGALGTAEAVGIVEAVVRRIENSANELVLFTQDTHQGDYLDTAEGKWLPVVHCVEDTEGWQINDDVLNAWRSNKDRIVVPEIGNIFRKSVFGSVELVDFLKSRVLEISEIEILGLCTDICVVSNAIMIKNFLPEIEVSVNAACCAGVTPKSHEEALNIMKMCHIKIIE